MNISEDVLFEEKIEPKAIAISLSVILLFACNTIYFIYTAYKDYPPKLDDAAFGMLLGAFGLFFLWVLLVRQGFKLYKDRIELFTVRGHKTTIFLNEISAWYEQERKNSDNISYKYLLIYTGNNDVSSFGISSQGLENYKEIKKLITAKMPGDPEGYLAREKRKSKQYGYPMIVLGVLLLLLTLQINLYYKTPVSIGQFTKMSWKVTDADNVRVIEGELKVEWSKYPGFSFWVPADILDPSNALLVKNKVKTGDTLAIDIFTDDYNKKLTRRQPLSLADMGSDYNAISIFGLTLNHDTYLAVKPQAHKALTSSLFMLAMFSGLIGAGLFAAGYYYLVLRK